MKKFALLCALFSLVVCSPLEAPGYRLLTVHVQSPEAGGIGPGATLRCAARLNGQPILVEGNEELTLESPADHFTLRVPVDWIGNLHLLCEATREQELLLEGRGQIELEDAVRPAALRIGLKGPLSRCTSRGWCRVDPDGSSLNAIHGTDGRNVWAVGDGGLILRYDGWRWKQVLSGVTADLRGVFATSYEEAWAVGEGTILRYDGERWTVVDLVRQFGFPDSPTSLNAIWGSDASHVWAVGEGGAILRWDGSRWDRQTAYDPANKNKVNDSFVTVGGLDAGRVWTASSAGLVKLEPAAGLWYRWVPGTPSPNDCPSFDWKLPRIWTLEAKPGEPRQAFVTDGRGAIRRLDQPGCLARSDSSEIFPAALVSGTTVDSAWLLSDKGVIARLGLSLAPAGIPETPRMLASWAASDRARWLVGEGGWISFSDGRDFTSQRVGWSSPPRILQLASGETGHADKRGAVLALSGSQMLELSPSGVTARSAWRAPEPGLPDSPGSVSSVVFTSAQEAWALDGAIPPKVWRWNGAASAASAWSALGSAPLSPMATTFALSAHRRTSSSRVEVFVADSAGQIYSCTDPGAQTLCWKSVGPVFADPMKPVKFQHLWVHTKTESLWAAGTGGASGSPVVMRREQSGWGTMSMPTTQPRYIKRLMDLPGTEKLLVWDGTDHVYVCHDMQCDEPDETPKLTDLLVLAVPGRPDEAWAWGWDGTGTVKQWKNWNPMLSDADPSVDLSDPMLKEINALWATTEAVFVGTSSGVWRHVLRQ
ncbi:MAG: hypothetical protein U1A78_25080 [Polyangia bacterium]